MQRVQSFDKNYQFLLFAAEPYEIIGFKVFIFDLFLLLSTLLLLTWHFLL